MTGKGLEDAQKPSEPAQQQSEVVGGSEHGSGAVAIAALKVIAADLLIRLEMNDDRFVHMNEKSSEPAQK